MKIRVFEAFAGYGSQAMALERLKQDYPEFENSINGRVYLLFEGLKALAQDNPDLLTIMSHVVAILSEDESPIIIN